ncbi:hypothetical protein LSTR_LSTR000744 [Laodelphax striatellus]|uniref:F-box domain-containing protein n=1 Tax=Laodelphax striatellus TaxID=195883 RepID=A0A482XGD0_LAOST|nr:hypothetical protein LSTR_LSTR000744 [Laodelphax striatellus]
MMDFVALFPPELTEEVFSYLPVRDLIVCGTVCMSWRVAANNSRLWKKLEKNFESWLLPDSRVKRCDVITRNFKDNSHSLEALIPKDDLSFNWLKVFVCQRNFLKHNWSHCIFTDNWLQVRGCIEYVNCGLFYPSKSPHDCLYFPFLGKFKDGSHALMLMRLDAKPKIVAKLFTTNDRPNVQTICVMRDCVVWLNGDDVKYFSLTIEFDKSEVRTLGNLDFKSCAKFLSMDSNNIVAGSLSINVWSKTTLALKCVINPQSECFFSACCWLYDGCLIQGLRTNNGYSSIIKIYNIKDHPTLQNEFVVDGAINSIECNKRMIFLHYFDLRQAVNCIEVHDKETFSTKCYRRSRLAIEYYLTHEASNDYISFGNFNAHKIEVCHFSSNVEEYELTEFNGEPHFVFDSIALVYGRRSLEVWDWKRKNKLYNLCNADIPGSYIVHVSEARVVVVDLNCNFQIYSFC